jgi:hypothetical protein
MASRQSDLSSSPEKVKSRNVAGGNQNKIPKSANPDKDAIAIRYDTESPEMIRKRMYRWIFGSSVVGYCLSFFFHSTLLTVLAFITYTEIGQTALNTIITETEELENIFVDSIDTKFEMQGIDNEEVSQPEIELADLPLDMQLPDLSKQLTENLLKDIGRGEGEESGDGTEDGNGKGKQFLFKMPTSDKVITKGSFTAWTEPEDPKPGQNYFIVIQIKLPRNIKRYRVKDLSGKVIGTDHYRQKIPGRYKKKYLPVKNHTTQFAVLVPGAHALVEDSITIESKILKEKQTLLIVF